MTTLSLAAAIAAALPAVACAQVPGKVEFVSTLWRPSGSFGQEAPDASSWD